MSPPADRPRDGAPQSPTPGGAEGPTAPDETCDLCGSDSVVWRNCKLICLSCRAIVRSCSDL